MTDHEKPPEHSSEPDAVDPEGPPPTTKPPEAQEPPQGDTVPVRHLPNIGDKPLRPRRKRWGRKIMVGTGAFFVVSTVVVKLLQHYEPGPRPVPIQQPAIKSLASLAIEKGFPEKCLGYLYKGPFENDPLHNPNLERQECEYSGHATNEPASDDSCEVILERDAWADTYHFSFNVIGTDGTPIYFGKDSQFSEIPAKQGVPAACAQENMDFR